MTPLETAVVRAFAGQADLRPRQGQLDMALAVAEAVESGSALAVEAGTGVGKTFAYLVPLLLSGRHAVLSTATQALQDQLFGRDIPAVSHALGLPVRVALLKGRSSYVCVHRLDQARTAPAPSVRHDPALTAGLEHVHRWAMASRSGDLAELPGLDERSPLWSLISSTRENCLGGACPRHADCHVNRAWREALQADWVVINHHLFFADQQVRESGVAELLPRAGVVVFDEAHQLNQTGIGFSGLALGSGQVRDLARDLSSQGPRWARGQRPWSHLALGLEQAARAFPQPSRPADHGVSRSRWPLRTPEGVDAAHWVRGVAGVAAALSAAIEALEATAGASADMQRLWERAQALQADWTRLTAPSASDADGALVRWVDWGSGAAWKLVCAPLDASAHFRQLMGDRQDGRSWVFTSATLGSDETVEMFTGPLGLRARADLRTLLVPSPFDHMAQAALYVPHDLPEPADPDHTPELSRAVARWASRLGGRTLVLTTTLRAASRMAAQLQALVSEGRCEPMQVLAQGHGSKRALLARFRAAEASPQGAVLVASASFWEGVDLAGDVLQLLVIDKLPFPPPDDPLIEARARQLERHGESAFSACYLPQAALALKQGAGRLIRSESDRGVLVIGDRRLLTRSYGQRLLGALPPMRRLVDEEELMVSLDELAFTRPSTTGHSRS